MRIFVINGPNLNRLGKREPHIYGRTTLPELEAGLVALGAEMGVEVTCFQSNMEGELVEAIQRAGEIAEGIILNAGAYTHTSVAVRDAVLCCGIPVVEVHLSNPLAREPFRHVSLLSDVCAGSIAGFGVDSYGLALQWFAREPKRPGEEIA
jgi:3-dehydroquinate dehydratase II